MTPEMTPCGPDPKTWLNQAILGTVPPDAATKVARPSEGRNEDPLAHGSVHDDRAAYLAATRRASRCHRTRALSALGVVSRDMS
jgi:hypothetical protein